MLKTSLAAALLSVALVSAPALAQEGGHATIERQSWTFAGPFGKFDVEQLQRGFQVFRQVCSTCHDARLLAFRNLAEDGGPEFTEGQVKALAAEYDIADAEATGGTRKGVPADHWPNPFPSEADARAAFNGAVPPDLSVMAKARGVTDPFPTWVFNYFTAYAEGGPDYIHALLLGYRDEVPPGVTDNEGKPFQLPEGKYYNEVFPGHAISMPPPLADGVVDYAEGAPETADQYARDVAAFLMWVAEPHMVERKEDGFRVILFLILFAGLMWFVKDRLWRPIHHHNPSPRDVAERPPSGEVH
jgi:ubiquinol-cytochrome c reductase cytochrome c1 subunit